METKKVLGCAGIGWGGLIVVILMFVIGIFFAVTSLIKSSDAYQTAMEKAAASPAVHEALGSPVEAGFMITGKVNTTGPTGDADISIPLSAPKGDGTLYVVAKKSAGLWNFSTFEFEGPSGQRVDLMPEGFRDR